MAVYSLMDNMVRLPKDYGHLCGIPGGRYLVLARDSDPDRYLVVGDGMDCPYPARNVPIPPAPSDGSDDKKD